LVAALNRIVVWHGSSQKLARIAWWILALEVLAIISITTPETNKNTLKITERSNK